MSGEINNNDLSEFALHVQSLARRVPNWTVSGTDVSPYLPSLEQFAQLIIRECAELTTREYDRHNVVHGLDILEHWGIKE